MPSDRWRFCVLLLLSLAGYGAAQVLGNASTKASLRVGDYADELSNGTALPLYTLIWRAVGSSFFSSDGVNQTFATDANNAFLAANHTMTYTVANIRNTAVINTTRKANGTAVEEWQTDSDYLGYSSIDLLMRTTFTQDSVWEDLGVTQQSHRVAVSGNLAARGWNMTAVVPMRIQIASEAAGILQIMPLPSYSSYEIVIQVTGSNVLPSSLQKQNIITDTLLTLLASDHVFLIRLLEVDEAVLGGGQGSATMTFVMQKSSDTAAISTALELVLGRADTPGSQAKSAFTAALANHSMNATATVLSETSFEGDSLQDQIYALTTQSTKPKKHLGAIIGSSVGSGVALLVLAATFIVFGRGWLSKRRLQKQTAAWRKEEGEMAKIENGKASFHDSGSSLNQHSIADGASVDDVKAAKCWDIDASDIVMCKRPDGADWLLSSSESGQVYKAIRGGVQDVVVKTLTSSTNLARQDLRKEVEVLKSVSYDRNVVQFYGTCPHGDQTMLVLEYMEGGDLRHALTSSSNGELKWHNKGATIALDIVRGLHFLHSHGVMHMDLKASNVFLTKTYSIAKIGEVDMAQVMGSSALQPPHAATFAYSAPELILNGRCTEKVDMYSFGVILWELITSEVPRRGRLRAIKVPEECPAEIEQLIDLCLATDSADRPSAKQAFDTISSCSPPLAAPALSTPTPKFQRQAPISSGPTEVWTQASAVHNAERGHESPSAPDSQSAQLEQRRQQSLGSWKGAAHSLQSHAQTSEDVNGYHHPAGPPDGELHQPRVDYSIRQHGLHQSSRPRLQTKGPQVTIQSDSQQHNGHWALPLQQDDVLSGFDLHSLPDLEQFPADAVSPQHQGGPEGALPLGMFGHLYPSPFATADDESSGPLWCWRNEQPAS